MRSFLHFSAHGAEKGFKYSKVQKEYRGWRTPEYFRDCQVDLIHYLERSLRNPVLKRQ